MSSTWYYISTLKDYVLLWHYTTLAKNEWLLRSWHPTLWLIIGQNQDLLMRSILGAVTTATLGIWQAPVTRDCRIE